MGGRKKHRKQHDPANVPPRASTGGALPDPPTRLFALQKDVIAVAFGTTLRAYDMRTRKLMHLSGPDAKAEGHAATIRALAFDPAGRHLLAGDDAKLCRVWDLRTGLCTQHMLLQKKVSAVGSTADGEWALAADKFGDVYVAPLRSAAHASASDSAADPDAASSDAAVANGQQHGDATHDGDAAAAPQAASAAGSKPALLLGHYNATITSLTVTADGSSLVSTDRDGKARVSVLPSHPLQGANEIRSYCVGHTQFVSCSAFISQGDLSLLATGSGDGSVRLWQHATGLLAETAQLTQPAQADTGSAGAAGQHVIDPAASEPPGIAGGSTADAEPAAAGAATAEVDTLVHAEGDVAGDDDGDDDGGLQQQRRASTHPAVLAIAVSPSGRTIAAVLEGADEVVLLSAALRRGRNCGLPKGVLKVAQRLALPELRQPFAVAFQPDGRLWAAGIAADTDADNRCIVLCTADRGDGHQEGPDSPEEYVAADPNVLGGEARAALEGCGGGEAAGGATSQLGTHLKRKVYLDPCRTDDKRTRMDGMHGAAASAVSAVEGLQTVAEQTLTTK